MLNGSAFEWLDLPMVSLDVRARDAARVRQGQLTKPRDSLGRLETIAEQFASWQGRTIPQLERIRVCVFAADHGVAAQGVSAFPQEVTTQMIKNFCAGGAAVSVLSDRCGADFRVVNLGCVHTPEPHARLVERSLGPGTADFSLGPAMTREQLAQALQAGREQVLQGQYELFIAGEMGIGNTTAASALEAALLGLKAEWVVGRGTGVNAETLEHKRNLIDKALKLHRLSSAEPLRILQCVGGFEIAAMAGAYIACGQRGIPALVDGFISTAAALVACRLLPKLRPWLLFGHQSTEPGHRIMLKYLEAQPLLSLEMRLGEGSGAVLAVPLLQSALALHERVATFADAGVSNA